MLSSVPMIIIGYTFGGLPVVIAVLVLVCFVHVVEAYYLNPKIVSSYMEFPIFITFLVLLVSEQLFGFLGLLVGMPLFYITVDIFRDINAYIDTIRTTQVEAKSIESSTREKIGSSIRLSRSGKRHEG